MKTLTLILITLAVASAAGVPLYPYAYPSTYPYAPAGVCCNPATQAAIAAPLSGALCGPCCDPIEACLVKKLRNYSIFKKKLVGGLLLCNTALADKLICGL